MPPFFWFSLGKEIRYNGKDKTKREAAMMYSDLAGPH